MEVASPLGGAIIIRKGLPMEYIQLNDGNKIPAIGVGVFMIPNDGPTYEAVLAALEAG